MAFLSDECNAYVVQVEPSVNQTIWVFKIDAVQPVLVVCAVGCLQTFNEVNRNYDWGFTYIQALN